MFEVQYLVVSSWRHNAKSSGVSVIRGKSASESDKSYARSFRGTGEIFQVVPLRSCRLLSFVTIIFLRDEYRKFDQPEFP